MIKKISLLPFLLFSVLILVHFGCSHSADSDDGNVVSTYTVTYYGNDNTSGSPPVDTNTYRTGDIVTILGNSDHLLRFGYNFNGWNVTSDGSGTSYSPGQTFTMGSTNVSAFARWNIKWTRLRGAASADTKGYDIAIDSEGNSYITGVTFGSIDDQTLTGLCDVFVIKYDKNGIRQWTRQLGAAGANTDGKGITVDSNGNTFITGGTYGNLDGETLTGITDVFTVKYNASGVKQWIRLLGVNAQYTYGEGISLDSFNNLYVIGSTQGDLDGETLTGTQDLFIIKYNKDGVKQWTKLLGVADEYTSGYGIAVDSDDNLYITGQTYGSLDGETLTGNIDVLTVKYNASGVKQWTRLLGVTGSNTRGAGISVDSNGNSYVTGRTGGNLDGQTLTGTQDLFIIKYNTDGVKQWTRLLGSTGTTTWSSGISVDSNGNAYVSGWTFGDLEDQTRTGDCDALAVKYNSNGELQWARLLGVFGNDTYGNGISIDSNGSVFITGNTNDDLDGETLSGSIDVFVTSKLNE